MRRKVSLSLFATFLLLPALTTFGAEPSKSWPTWRGPLRNGISTETGLLSTWSKAGPPLLWRIEGLGKGYSSLSIENGKIFTMGQRRNGTELIALSLKDGKELWSTPVGNGSPNCSPTVDGELVYALGRGGKLVCVKAANGEVVWEKNYRKAFGGKMMSGWGYSESPLVDKDMLICTPGAEDAMIAALDKKTGKILWKSSMPADIGRKGRDGAGYSSVVISEGAGVRQYITLVGKGVVSVDAKTGKTLWVYNRVANGTANIPTPIIKDNYVFCSSGYGTGAALLKLEKDGTGVKAVEQYFLNANTLQNHHGGMILIGDYIYCGHKHNNGFPICVEMKTGKVMWGGNLRGPGSGSAAIVYADGHLYFRYENAVMALIEATPKAYKLKGSFKLASKNGRSWPHPVILGGKLYLRDQGTLLCYDITKKK